ncbi:hypothetical protein AC1031_018381 [Aphanomyces cochlioides]|nr:hypothetical protein AC1031_018381 [Aphanomyces cochlioides]
MENATDAPNATAASLLGNLTTKAPKTLSPAAIEGLRLQQFVNNQYQILQIVYSISYATMFLLCVFLVVYLRRNRSTAYQGDSDATRKAILPTFESLLWVLCGTTGLYTVYFIVAAIFSYTEPITWRWFAELLPAGRQFILFLILSFLLQRSVSVQSLRRAMLISFIMAAIPVIGVHILDQTKQTTVIQSIVPNIYRLLLCLGFVWLYFRPIGRANARTQRELAAFAMVYYVIVFVYSGFFLAKDSSTGFMLVFCAVIWASFAPVVVWRLLKADTEHWRGLGDRACELQQLFREKQGIEEIVSSQGLHVLLEMHHRDLIDFAHLELERKIGVGASADVYRGKLRSTTQVAVKVYSPSEISEGTILAFSQEAALCRALKHPNIVYFHGMCICPPMICLVSELCRGSLEDALMQPRQGLTEPMWPKLCFMLDAARAVAYLHSFSPPFLHRDIKPANFLLGANNRVKLTDFGESRSMASGKSADSQMTMRGTVDYMAPEVIEGKAGKAHYTQTADIYSLAITLWDVLHPNQEKFPAGGNHLNVYKMVVEGQRPPIDPEIHPTLHELLENAWHADATFRPAAKVIVATLEDLHEELCSEIMPRLAQAMMCLSLPIKSKPTFSGHDLVTCLIDHEYAIEVEEAVRLGNALMDVGCLHHVKHALPFEDSTVATYCFDEHQLDLNDPLNEDEAHVTIAGDDSSYGALSILGDASGTCACRRLGQGHVKMKPPKKKIFRRQLLSDQKVLTVNLLRDVVDEFEDEGSYALTNQTTLA